MPIPRFARKLIYRFEHSDSGISRVSYASIISAYQAWDLFVSKRYKRADFFSEKIICHEKKFCLVFVPKCASRTLLNGLRENQRDGRIKEFSILEKPLDDRRFKLDQYLWVTFVRDPWSRLVSCYRQKLELGTKLTYARSFNGRVGVTPTISFPDFVFWVCNYEGRDEVADRHWLSQHKILGIDQGISYDFIGRLENFSDDLRYFCSETGLDFQLFGHYLKSGSADSPQKYYTTETWNMVYDRYRRDIDLFGYDCF